MTLEAIAGKARSTVQAMAPALKLTDAERLQLAELLRTRRAPTDRNGAISVDLLVSLVQELRHEA
jgi:hypothetical protein